MRLLGKPFPLKLKRYTCRHKNQNLPKQKLLQESVPVNDEWKPSVDSLRGKSTMKTQS